MRVLCVICLILAVLRIYTRQERIKRNAEQIEKEHSSPAVSKGMFYDKYIDAYVEQKFGADAVWTIKAPGFVWSEALCVPLHVIKDSSSEDIKVWKNDIVPFEYYLQVAYYMAIKNVPYAVICVKFGISEEDFKYFVIHRDFDVEDEILKMAEELCKDVESGVEPSLDRGKAELLLQYYKKRFGSLKVKERNVLLDTSYIFDAEELIELHEKLESAKQAEKQYKSDIKEKTLAIAKAADGASTAYIPYGKTGKYVQVSLRNNVRKSSLVDVDKVYEKYPDLYERYVERNFNAAAFIKENPQLLEECKKDELVYSESTSDGVKMVEQGYVDKIFRNMEEGKNGKNKKK